MTTIFMLEEGKPDVRRVASYSCSPKQALVAYVMQYIKNNWNTWEYPEMLEGMRESQTIADHWYYDLFKGRNAKVNAVISAYPDNSITGRR